MQSSNLHLPVTRGMPIKMAVPNHPPKIVLVKYSWSALVVHGGVYRLYGYLAQVRVLPFQVHPCTLIIVLRLVLSRKQGMQCLLMGATAHPVSGTYLQPSAKLWKRNGKDGNGTPLKLTCSSDNSCSNFVGSTRTMNPDMHAKVWNCIIGWSPFCKAFRVVCVVAVVGTAIHWKTARVWAG